MLFVIVLMTFVVIGCKESSSRYSPEEIAHLKECHEILDEYKDYWTPDENYTDEQRDSMLLKADPDSLRSFFELFMGWNDEDDTDCRHMEFFE